MTTSTLVLLIYLLFLVPAMLMGFSFARRKLFRPHHKWVMTGITLANWVLIIAVMLGSYGGNVVPYLSMGIGQPSLLLPTIHLVTGGIAQMLATYLVILMWFEPALPKFMVTHKIKTPMRLTLALWLITAMLGLGIYIVWNAPASSAASITPVITEEASVVGTPDGVVTDAPVATIEPVSTAAIQPVATEDDGGRGRGRGRGGDDKPDDDKDNQDDTQDD